MKTEYAWLIERLWSGRPVWWAPGEREQSCPYDWSPDSLVAVRFSRREDAEKVWREIVCIEGCIVTEHGWADQPSSGGEGGVAAERDGRIR